MRQFVAAAGVMLAFAAVSLSLVTNNEVDAGTGISFLETFTGDPAAPAPWQSNSWDVAVHSRNPDTFDFLTGMQTDHQADCGDPFHDGSGTHFNNTYEGAVYQCKNHLMTSITEGGYGLISLPPNHLRNFSDGPVVIGGDTPTARPTPAARASSVR